MEISNITSDQVEEAIKQFYTSGNGGQSQVHQWLTVIQLSPHAWQIVWDLLSLDKPTEVQFFSANTLHVKVSKFWREVPEANRDELQSKLLSLSVQYSRGPKVVLNKLLQSVAAFLIHTVEGHEIQRCEEILASVASLVPPPSNLLLEILTLLPEEFQNTSFLQNQRGLVRNCLLKLFPKVLTVAQDALLSSLPESEIPISALRCLLAWIQLGVSLADIEPLFPAILGTVRQPSMAASALEVLSSMLTQGDSSRYPHVVQRMLEQLFGLEDFLLEAEAQEDMDLMSSIYAVFIGFGECHTKLILQWIVEGGHSKELALKLIHLILKCTALPGHYPVDEVCSEQAFTFWYLLQDEIIASSTTPVGMLEIQNVLYPIYKTLVEVLLTKGAYPAYVDSWKADEKESFRCYRQDVGDTLMYCFSLLHEIMLELLDGFLEKVVSEYQPDRWQALESVLHAYCSIADCIDSADTVAVPKFFHVVPVIQETGNREVISTTLSAIGSYAEWMVGQPSLVPKVLPLVLNSIAVSQLAGAASVALKELARDCQEHLTPFAPQILDAVQNALGSSEIRSPEKVRLMYPTGRVLSLLPSNQILQYLDTLLSPCIGELQALTQLEASMEVKNNLVVYLKMFGMLCSCLDLNPDSEEKKAVVQTPGTCQPVLLIVQQLMPTLRHISQNWCGNCEIIEGVCSLLKQALSTLKDDSAPMVSDLVTMAVNMYQMFPHPTILELGKQLIVMYGGEIQHSGALGSFFHQVCSSTLRLCDDNRFREQTDTMEAFLSLLAHALKKHPKYLTHPSLNLNEVFQLGVIALGMPETPTAKAAASFLSHFIHRSRDLEPLLSVMNAQGEFLVHHTLRFIGGESPRANSDCMTDVLLALNKKFTDSLSRWLAASLSQDGFPTPRVSPQQKENFCKSILRERTNKRKLGELVREFALVCRGLVSTEYGGQSIPLPTITENHAPHVMIPLDFP
ncbi:unnamed protein product [Darwinula stevensoni]|uniref:Importin-13 n=1 Tax=Darwinula stevensoni TaxID=69355 RepID=A0A7R8XDB7_9CRUS|nr:unnamed protein product [Darwinula stevensoni]CAG0894556.1 unnamed protein product [Darwinula stevensoni]